jgi:hypothetical protein
MKNQTTKIVLLFSIPVALFLVAFTIEAPLIQGDFGSLEAVVIWVVTGGGAMWITGKVEAYLLENWPSWHTFPRWVKVLFPVVMAGVLGIAGQSILTLELIAYIPDGIEVTLLAIINWYFSQKGYQEISDTPYGDSARNDRPVG